MSRDFHSRVSVAHLLLDTVHLIKQNASLPVFRQCFATQENCNLQNKYNCLFVFGKRKKSCILQNEQNCILRQKKICHLQASKTVFCEISLTVFCETRKSVVCKTRRTVLYEK